MPCYYPQAAVRTEGGVVFVPNRNHYFHNLTLACGQCHGCKLKSSRDWGIRAMHENQMWEHTCAITLTYNDEHLPRNLSLNYRHWQLFMKRLRKAASRGHGGGIAKPNTAAANALITSSVMPIGGRHSRPAKAGVRFYMGGEYGEKYGRPHYHACLYNVDFLDKKYHGKTKAGTKIYTSETLDKIWGMGFASIGAVNFQTAAYIARYIMKKRTGDGELQNYQILDLETGEIQTRRKEFNQMSRRPGLGAMWLQQYQTDAFPHGKVVLKNHQVNTPRYYDKQFARIDKLAFKQLQHVRQLEAYAQRQHHTDARLKVQEHVAKARTQSLLRDLKGQL